MSQFGGNFYRYDAVGIRQEKRSGSIDGTLTAIYYTDGGIIHREDRPTVSQSLRYHYSLIGVTGFEWVRIGHPTTHIHLTYNALGDVVGVFQNGVLQARYVYDTWGNHRVLNASGVVIFDSRVGVVMSGHENNMGIVNPWRWRGQYYDQESNLFYMGGRYYDPRLRHIINATLDEANATGGYMYSAPNPLDIFPGVGNFFALPTWGYPELYIPEWQQEQSRSGWSWRNFWIALGVTLGAVAVGVLTFGIGAKIVAGVAIKVGVKKTAAVGLGATLKGSIAPSVAVGAGNMIGTGISTRGFSDMGAMDFFNLGISSFFGGLGAGLGGKISALSPAGATGRTLLKHAGIQAAVQASVSTGFYLAENIPAGNFSWGGLGIAFGTGALAGATFKLKGIPAFLIELLSALGVQLV